MITHLKTLCMSILSLSGGVESEWKRYGSPVSVEKMLVFKYEFSFTMTDLHLQQHRSALYHPPPSHSSYIPQQLVRAALWLCRHHHLLGHLHGEIIQDTTLFFCTKANNYYNHIKIKFHFTEITSSKSIFVKDLK